jgi:hypothetical protein
LQIAISALFYAILPTKSKQKNDLLVRGFENTQENFFNFCREVGKVLCRTLAITHEKFLTTRRMLEYRL